MESIAFVYPVYLNTLTSPKHARCCDYIERGYSEHIQLGNLQNHVSRCGFAPVTCEKCGMQINRKDKDNHEKSFCQIGAANCKECGNIKANHDEMKQKISQMKAEMKNGQDEMKASLDNIKQKQNVMLTQLNEIMNDQQEYLTSVNENLNELKRSHDQMEVRVLRTFTAINIL